MNHFYSSFTPPITNASGLQIWISMPDTRFM